MLALDTLKWSTLEPHPLGFSAPAIHGHTAVEDPAHAGRLIIFGGRGGKNWNTQVLTFQFRKNLWSMAVCDMGEPPPDELNANQSSTSRGKRSSASPLRVTILDNPVIGRTEPSRGGSDEPKAAPAPPSSNNTNDERPQNEPLGEPGQQPKMKDPAPSSSLAGSLAPGGLKGNANNKNSNAAEAAKAATEHSATAMVAMMPHQRHGHTCFVWDPRQAALACNGGGGGGGGAGAGGGGDGDGARASPVSPMRGGQNRGNRDGSGSSGRSNGGVGGGAGRKSSPTRPLGGDNNNTTALPLSRKGVGGGGSRSGGGGGGGRSRNRRTPTPSSPTDESLPNPCIVTFGGSALRTGGGYARAALHVLEAPAPEDGGRGNDDNDSDKDGGGRKCSSPSTGILASLELAADAPKQTFNKFQSCTNSVLLKVHSLRQLGNEQLTFGDSYNPEDLSYIDLKVQSVVLGVGDRNLQVGGRRGHTKGTTGWCLYSSNSCRSSDNVEDEQPHSTHGGLLVGFPQVKAFLADARPANARIRPVSAPAHLVEPGGGGGGGVLDKGRKAAGGRRWNEHESRRRPGTAGAAIGSGARRGDHHERSSLPPMMPSTHAASDSSRLARPNSRIATASGGRHLHHQRVDGGGGDGGSSNSSTAGGGVGDNNHASTGEGSASFGGTTDGGLGGSLTLGERDGDTPTLFYHRSVPGGAPGGRAGGGAGNLGRVPMLGRRPLLVPKATMAAHNGRLLMEHEWADAGFFY
ncbi:unnamed protein product [Ectocarpus sp. 13 AM-2016]